MADVFDTNEVQDLIDRLDLERRVYDGALALLQVFDGEDGGEVPQQGPEERAALKRQVEDELATAGQRIADLQDRITALQGDTSVEEHSESSHRLRFEDVDPDEEETRDMATELLRDLSQQPEPEAMSRMNTVTSLIQRSATQHILPPELAFSCLLPMLSDDSTITVRAATYRLLRHFLMSESAVDELRRRHLDIYLVRTLSRDARFDLEKQQVLRTIRHVLQYPGRVSPGVMKAVVAVAENGEDKLRLVCLELLAELVICDIDLLSQAGGLRVVLQALVDGPYEIAPTLASLFLYLVDVPKLRGHLRPGMDIEMALDGLSERPGKGHHYAEKTKSSVRIIAMLLKSWSGLLYLCSENKQAISSLVQCLYLPAVSVCETLLDTLFEIFRVKTASWFDDYLSGKRLTAFRRSRLVKRDHLQQAELAAQVEHAEDRATLIDQYLGLLLMVFVEAGLLEGLVHVAESVEHAALSRKASLLIGEVLYLSNRILPLDFVSHLQALPRLFALASAFSEDLPRLAGTTALQSVDSFARNMARLHGHETSTRAGKELRNRSNSVEDPLKRGQRAVDTTKMKIGVAIDDTAFRNLLVDTQVLIAPKEEHRWNCEALFELFEGALLNPTRFDEVNKGSKFLRRLITFFYPFEGRFAGLPRNATNERWGKLLLLIIDTLLLQPEGIRFLQGDKLLPQIADGLLSLNPHYGGPASESLFSRQRLESSMSYAYLDLVALLTRSKAGSSLLDRFHLTTALYSAADVKSREDVTRMMLEGMDYSSHGHPRILLSKALTSEHKAMRLYATRLLGRMLNEAGEQSTDWMIRLLLVQLFDPVESVSQLAVELLDEACNDSRQLDLMVALRPSLDHLGDVAAPLLFRFLGSSVGVRYLHSIGYVEQELDEWYDQRNRNYVVQLELQLARFFSFGNPRQQVPQLVATPVNAIGAVPPHFYGELVKAPEGAEILRAKGHTHKFASFIRKHGLEDDNPGTIFTLKSVLWALGHIGSSAHGIQLLEEENAISEVVKVAHGSRCYSVRGTCFYVLGLLANSQRGVELLAEQGWIAACSPLGEPVGICVPVKLEAFLVVPSAPAKKAGDRAAPRIWSATHNEREAVSAMASLTNHLMTHKSSKALAKLRARQADLFDSPALFCRAVKLMETLHYRLPARRFIFDLLTMPITPENLDLVAKAREELDAGQPPALTISSMDTTSMEDHDWVAGAADFSDEEEEGAVEATLAKQELTPREVVKGFDALPPANVVH